jgi:hypothetical protein
MPTDKAGGAGRFDIEPFRIPNCRRYIELAEKSLVMVPAILVSLLGIRFVEV